ncbi:MAG: ParA family protein [Oscillospiraceae bacterium]|nr:ParA family protein [Oscillospiraceae bacterium]
MKTIAIMNLKGGVGKTITAVNMAALLAEKHGKRVLLVDADHQGNTSSFFCADADGTTLRDILLAQSEPYWADCVQASGIEGLGVVPSDMRLADLDVSGQENTEAYNRRFTRLRDFITCAAEDDAYDFCIIDLPPAFSTASKAALVAADEVIIPIKIDAFSVSGLAELLAQVDNLRKVNPSLRVAGTLVTMYRNSELNSDALCFLQKHGIPCFGTLIRWTDKLVDESTFAHRPLHLYSPRCAASVDYRRFVVEYLEEVSRNGR